MPPYTVDFGACYRTAESFVGIHEDPAHSNRTPIGAEYGWNGVPWCAITFSVIQNRNGFPVHEAAVVNLELRGRTGWNGMGWSSVPVLGSAACFDYSGVGDPNHFHTGFVYDLLYVVNGQAVPIPGSVNPYSIDRSRLMFRTIEGNYADRVDRWLRDMKYIRGFATIPYTTTPAPAPTPPPHQETDVEPTILVSNPNMPPGHKETLQFKLNVLSGIVFVKNVIGKTWDKLAPLPFNLHPISFAGSTFEANGDLQVSVWANDGNQWIIGREVTKRDAMGFPTEGTWREWTTDGIKPY